MDDLSSRHDLVAAAAVSSLPDSGTAMDWYVGAEGYVPADPNADFVQYRTVTPGHFQTLRIPLLRGRWFADEDRAKAQPVAIVSESLAKPFWGDRDPIGRRIRPNGQDSSDPWHIVVGVVGNIHDSGPRTGNVPIWYRCAYQDPWRTMIRVVRIAGDPEKAVRATKDTLVQIDPRQPVYQVRPMSALPHDIMSTDSLNAAVLAFFASLALTLAAVGIYGVLAHAVGQRTPEIGVRMALGARCTRVLGSVLQEGMTLGACGLGLGLAGTLALARLLQWLLFGVAASDPVTFAGMAAVLIHVGAFGCLLPAWRASRVDPLPALRHE